MVSQEVTDFFCHELRLPKLPGRWQKRTLRYLRNRCGHRFLEEGAVCKAREEISSGKEKESRCEELGLQAGDVSLQRAGNRSSAHLLTSRPGHLVTSELFSSASGAGGFKHGPSQPRNQFFRDHCPNNISLSPAPAAAAAATAAEAEVSPALVLREGGNKDPRSSFVWMSCLASTTFRLVSCMAHIPPYGRQEV